MYAGYVGSIIKVGKQDATLIQEKQLIVSI